MTTTIATTETIKPIRVEAGRYSYKGIDIVRIMDGKNYDGTWYVSAEDNRYGYESLKRAVSTIDFAERVIASAREAANEFDGIAPVKTELAAAYEVAARRLSDATDKLNTSYGNVVKNFSSWSLDSFDGTAVGIQNFINQQKEWAAEAEAALAEVLEIGEAGKIQSEEYRSASYRFQDADSTLNGERFAAYLQIWK